MFNIGPVELVVVLVLSLIIFGPSKLPELMANVGHAIREFQRASRELTDVFQETQQEFSSALSLDLDPPERAAATPTVASYDDTSNTETLLGATPEDFPTPTGEIAPIEDAGAALSQADISPVEYETAAAMLDEPESIDDEPTTVHIPPEPVPSVQPRRRRTKAAAAIESEDLKLSAGPESAIEDTVAPPRRTARRSAKKPAADQSEAPASADSESPAPSELAAIEHSHSESPHHGEVGDLTVGNGRENGLTGSRRRRRRVAADAVTSESA
ncbi:MAG: twin-arginine translocase TatA/TatE family subunit [Chloroflexota bacterium]|nr:MAG: twin-arginine translocase TatA/TatE family subunit [Chloroflexota bacterium]